MQRLRRQDQSRVSGRRSQADVGREHGVGGGMVEIVAHVGKEGAFRLELFDELEGVFNV